LNNVKQQGIQITHFDKNVHFIYYIVLCQYVKNMYVFKW